MKLDPKEWSVHMKILQKTLHPQFLKHKNLLIKKSCQSIHQIKKNKRKHYFSEENINSQTWKPERE